MFRCYFLSPFDCAGLKTVGTSSFLFSQENLRRFDRTNCGLETGGKAVYYSQKILAVIRFYRFWDKNRGNAVKMFPSSFFEVIGLYRFGFRHRGKCYFLSGNYESLQLHEVSV